MNKPRPINSGKRVDEVDRVDRFSPESSRSTESTKVESIDRVDRFSVELSRIVRLDRFQGLLQPVSAAQRRAVTGVIAAGRRRLPLSIDSMCSTRRALSSKPAARRSDGRTIGQTYGLTDAPPLGYIDPYQYPYTMLAVSIPCRPN